uniref:Uncharacterized protein n=1 Tax=Caenorhabditis japonica TaxID=281687 RepID=A0A8R1HYC3_CAEJA
MNNLVAYDADSDDESPRRRSSDASKFAAQHEEERKKRTRRDSDEYGDDFSPQEEEEGEERNFVEPPPPKRVSEHSPSPAAFRTPQMGMVNVNSQASLVSYSGEGDDDEDSVIDEKQFSAPPTELHEPAPPVRQSMDAESDEEQKLIDLAIKEGNDAMSRMNEDSSPAGSETPIREFDSPRHEENQEEHVEKELKIPAPPDVEVDPALVSKFQRAFAQKAAGMDLNRHIQGNPQYNNPMSYETFIETFDIDEKGTNFASNIFDPHMFPENCFYNAIAEEQRKLTEPPKKSK